ncbi:hypothetical protein V1504DRAFT_257141 [Lipomyces starkeyi]
MARKRKKYTEIRKYKVSRRSGVNYMLRNSWEASNDIFRWRTRQDFYIPIMCILSSVLPDPPNVQNPIRNRNKNSQRTKCTTEFLSFQQHVSRSSVFRASRPTGSPESGLTDTCVGPNTIISVALRDRTIRSSDDLTTRGRVYSKNRKAQYPFFKAPDNIPTTPFTAGLIISVHDDGNQYVIDCRCTDHTFWFNGCQGDRGRRADNAVDAFHSFIKSAILSTALNKTAKFWNRAIKCSPFAALRTAARTEYPLLRRILTIQVAIRP